MSNNSVVPAALNGLGSARTVAVGVYRHRHGTDVACYNNREEAVMGLLDVILSQIESGDADDQISFETQGEILDLYADEEYEEALNTYDREAEDETVFVWEGVVAAEPARWDTERVRAARKVVDEMEEESVPDE